MAEKEVTTISEDEICNMLKSNDDLLKENLPKMINPVRRFSKNETILHLAARHAGKEMMHYILENRGNLDITEENIEEYNILHCALEAKNKDATLIILNWITKLIQEIESIDEMLNSKCGKEGNTPLHLAYENKHYDMMTELVKTGANPYFANLRTYHTLYLAAKHNDKDAVEALLDGAKEGGDKAEEKLLKAKKYRNCDRMLPGLVNENMIEILLDGVEDHLRDQDFFKELGSILHWACDQNKLNLVNYLIKKKVPLNEENALGKTPLCIATHLGYYEICEALLNDNGVNPYQILKSDKLCALNYAATYGRLKILKILVQEDEEKNKIVEIPGIAKPLIHSAVFGGNYEVTKYLLEECKCNANTEHEINWITKKPLCIAIEEDHIPLIKLLLKNGASAVDIVSINDRQRPVHVAIKYGRRQALQILLEHGANPDEKDLGDSSPAQLTMFNNKDAANLLSLLLTYGISFTKRDLFNNTIVHTIANHGAVKCAEFFLEYLYNHHQDQIYTLVLEEKGHGGETALDIAIRRNSQGVLTVFFKYISIVKHDYFLNNPSIFHRLIENNLFDALKSLMDCHVSERFLEVELQTKFLDSIDSQEDPYPSNPHYKCEPSFIHKLIDCPDPYVKYHPIVTVVVEEKLKIYRWWYVLTFFLYCLFIVPLYFALIQASYLCDDMLLSYQDRYSRGRAFCEVLVFIFGIFFLIDEVIEFFGYWHQCNAELIKKEKNQEFNRVQDRKTKEKERSEVNNAEDRKMFILRKKIEWLKQKIEKVYDYSKKLDHFTCHFFSALLFYFDAFNIIDISGLVSLFFLILLRLSQVASQWTFASFTIILFTLKLFKYTRIFPSLGAYVSSIIKIFKNDITQFGIIIIIIMLAYFGGIHFAARQTISNPGPSQSLATGDTCGNQSYTNLFWFDQERTETYDLRRPLLTGILFLLDGGPANEENGLLLSNFLFTLVYLAFAFTIIVVMSNILIAQLSDTYGEVIKTSGYHYKLDLIVTIEYRSNLAIFLGRFLRYLTSNEIIKKQPYLWNNLKNSSPGKDKDLQIEENYVRLQENEKSLENAQLQAISRHEWVQDKIIEMGQTIDKNNEIIGKLIEDRETLPNFSTRMTDLEGKLNLIIEMIKQEK